MHVRCQKMNKSKYLKGACQHCAGHIEFPAENIGMVVTCPHCHNETELELLRPPDQPTIPLRALIWTGIAVVVLGLGLGGALFALKRAQNWALRQKQPAVVAGTVPPPAQPASNLAGTNAAPQEELTASDITIEKTPGSSLVYVVGTLKNPSARRRFGLKVQLDLLDSNGRTLGTASDYQPVLEPGAEWKFKALAMDSKTASAKLHSIQEDR